MVATIIMNYYFCFGLSRRFSRVRIVSLSAVVLAIKVSVEPFVVGLEFAVANFLIVQVKKYK